MLLSGEKKNGRSQMPTLYMRSLIICSHWSKNSSWTHHSIHTALRSSKTCAPVKTHFSAWPSLTSQQPWTWRPKTSSLLGLQDTPGFLLKSTLWPSVLVSLASCSSPWTISSNVPPTFRSLLPPLIPLLIALTHYFIYHQWLPECLSQAWMSFLASRFIYTTFFTSPLPCLIDISTTTSWKDLIPSIPYSRAFGAPTDNSLMR